MANINMNTNAAAMQNSSAATPRLSNVLINCTTGLYLYVILCEPWHVLDDTALQSN
jgi:hypothetical protein